MTTIAPCPGCAAQTEALAQWMHARGIATGHGETVADLLTQLSLDYRRAPTLRWRREPPDAPGWWWRRESRSPGELYQYDTDDCAYFADLAARERLRPGTEWAGPIEEPEEVE